MPSSPFSQGGTPFSPLLSSGAGSFLAGRVGFPCPRAGRAVRHNDSSPDRASLDILRRGVPSGHPLVWPAFSGSSTLSAGVFRRPPGCLALGRSPLPVLAGPGASIPASISSPLVVSGSTVPALEILFRSASDSARLADFRRRLSRGPRRPPSAFFFPWRRPFPCPKGE